MSKADAAAEIALDTAPPTGIIHPTLALIERVGLDPKATAETLERLVALHEHVMEREAQREYNVAMNRAQAEIEPVARTIQNKEDKHWYAKLEDVDRAIRPIYIKHGFSLSDNTVPPLKGEWIRVECRCSHIGGHTERFYREGPPDNIGPKGGPTKTLLHGVGSTDTYLRRYLHCGIFNVVFKGLDDDGNGGPISEEDVQDILARMEQGKVNSGKFLQYMRLPSTVGAIIAMIPKSDLGKALNALDELIKKAADGNTA